MFDFDPSKMFAAPSFDLKPLIAAQQKNLDAIVKASTVYTDGMKTIVKRQAELAQANLTAGISAAKNGGTMKDFDLKTQMEMLKIASEKAIAEGKEMVALATASSTKAFEVLRARNEEAAVEFKSMLKAA